MTLTPARTQSRVQPLAPGTTLTGGGDGEGGGRRTASGVAARIETALWPLLGGPLPVRLRAWDGSQSGPADGILVELRSPRALTRLLWHPGELGAAQVHHPASKRCWRGEQLRCRHDLDAGP